MFCAIIMRMDALFLASLFVFGAVLGSFLNVFILRYNTGRSLGGRSSCATCGRDLAWHELIPIVSFAFQRGRCRGCKSAISFQYPIVEILMGALLVLIGSRFLSGTIGVTGVATSLFEVIVWSILIALSVYDMRHKIIPDGLAYAFVALSALPLFGFPDAWGDFSFSRLCAGIGLAAFPAALWLVSRGRWMGLGDAKLLLGVGFLLGPALGISALLYAFWSGAILSVVLLSVRDKDVTMKSEIPFGPFIVFGMALAYFFQLDILSFLLY